MFRSNPTILEVKTFIIAMFCIFSQNISAAQLIPKDFWTIAEVDSEERKEDIKGSGFATCIIDNNINTFWTTGFKTIHLPFPHHVIIDLGGYARIDELIIHARKNRLIGRVAQFQITGSSDRKHWVVLSEGKFNWKANENVPITLKSKSKLSFRFVKFTAIKPETTNDNCIHLAEINISGAYVSPIIIPKISVSSSVIYQNDVAHYTDSSYVKSVKIKSRVWHFPGGNPSVSYEANPTVKYTKFGEHSASLTITTEKGERKAVTLPKAVNYLPAPQLLRGDWKISVDEQEIIASHDTSTNMIDGNPSTHWHTIWTYGKKLPHYIIINLGKETEICGIGYLPRQTGLSNGTFQKYKVYVSNDSTKFEEEACLIVESKPYKNIHINGFKPQTGQFVKIEIIKSFPLKKEFASASEIYLYGYDAEPFNPWWLLSIVLILLIIFTYIYRSTKKKGSSGSTETPDIETADPIVETKSVQMYLFGKFELAYKGEEVEQLFNKIKQILALITYHTIENEGISTSDLSKLLWAELPEENVSSARSSNIKKLRTAIETIPSIQIIIEKKLWRLNFEESEVTIDFYSYNELTLALTKQLLSNTYNEYTLKQYLNIIERGRFFENFEIDWADDIKNKISEEIIELLRKILTTQFDKLSRNVKIRICDCLFLQDELNVDALRMRLQLYCEESNLGLAKKTYDAYSRKYRQIYNEEFSISFSELTQA